MPASSLGQAVLTITANTRGAIDGLRDLSASVGRVSQSLATAGATLSAVGRRIAVFGASITAAISPAVVIGGKFEQAMANVKAVMQDIQGPTAEATSKFQELTTVAKELGASTVFTATQVAEAMEFMGLAGFNAQQTLEGVESVLNLAAAGMMDLGRASDIASDLMTAFNLKASDLSRVVDVMAQTSSNSNTTIELLGNSMKLAAPVASTLGQSIEHTATALGVLANAGLKGTVSGAGLAQALGQLVEKGRDANKILSKYGITIEDVSPDLVTLRDIVATFEQVNLSAGDAMALFGSRAGRMILSLKNQGVEAYDALYKLNEAASGVAEQMRNIRIDTTIGDITVLKSAISALMIEGFDAFKESLRDAVVRITRIVNVTTEWVKENRELVGFLVKVAVAIGSFLTVTGTAAAAFGTFVASIAAVVAIGAKMLVIALSITTGMMQLGAIIGAVVVPVIIAMKDHWRDLAKTFQDLWSNTIEPIVYALMSSFTEGYNKHIKPMIGALSASLGDLIEALGRLFEAFSGLTPAGMSLSTVFGELVTLLTGGFIEALSLVVDVMTVLVDLMTKAVSLASGMASAFGVVGGVVGSFGGKGVAAPSGDAAQDADLAAASERAKNSTAETRKLNAETRKYLSLMERLGDLSVVELKTLEEMQNSGKLDLQTHKDKNKELTREVAELDKIIESRTGASQQAKDEAAARRSILKQELTQNTAILNEMIAMDQIRKNGSQHIEKLKEEQQAIVDHYQEEINSLMDIIELKEEMGQSTRKEREDLKGIQESLRKNQEIIDRVTSMGTARADRLAALGGDFGSLRKDAEHGIEALKDQEDAAKTLIDTKKELDDIEQELSQNNLTGLQKESKALQDNLNAQLAVLESREKALLVTKDFLETRRIHNASMTDEALKLKLSVELNEKLAATEQDLAKVRRLRASATETAASKERELREAMAEGRKNSIRDLEIEALQADNKHIAAARLLNEKILEEERKKNDKIFELDGVNNEAIMEARRKQEELQAQAASRRLAAAFKKEGGRENVVQAAVDSAKLEHQIASKLASQVNSVREMFILYNALAHIRHVQEKRARAAAKNAVEEQQQLERLVARQRQVEAAGNAQMAAAMQRKIEMARAQVAITAAIAGNRAGEAQLGNAAGQGAAIADQQLVNQLAQLRAKLNETLGGIAVDFNTWSDQINDIFANAPWTWVDTFIGQWEAQAGRIVEAVQAIMHQVGVAMMPTTRNSPSLVDIWDMNSRAALQGVRKMQDTINSNMPTLSSFNATQAMGGVLSGTSTSRMSPRPMVAGDHNDNRRVQLDIHSNVDMENMKRQVGRALQPVGMSIASEI